MMYFRISYVFFILIIICLSVGSQCFAETIACNGYTTLNYTLKDNNTAVVKNLRGTNGISSEANYSFDTIRIPPFFVHNGKTYTVTTLGTYSFENCKNLKHIEIPNSVTAINSYSLKNCPKLEKIIFPSGITLISNMVLAGNTSLKEVILPATLVTIGDQCFWDCPSLKNIVVPASVEKIASWVSSTKVNQLNNSPINYIFLGKKPKLISTAQNSEPTTNVFVESAFNNSKMFILSKNRASFEKNKLSNVTYYSIDQISSETTIPCSIIIDEPIVVSIDAKRMYELSIADNAFITSTAGLSVRMPVDEGQYRFFSLPFDCALCNVTSEHGVDVTNYGSQWLVKRFDGERHATYGHSSTISSNSDHYAWISLSANDTLRAGEGYIIAIASPNSFSENGREVFHFTTTDTITLSHNNSLLSFTPSPLTTISLSTHQNTSVSQAYWGWNLVGTNLMHSLKNASLFVGEEKINYVSIPNADGKTYTQKETSQTTLLPYSSFFIQTELTGPLQIVYNAQPSLTKASLNTNMRIDLSLFVGMDSVATDATTLLLSDNYTTDYEINADLRKMRNDDTSQIMAHMTSCDLAFCAIPLSSLLSDSVALTISTPNYIDSTYVIELTNATIDKHNYSVMLYDGDLRRSINLTKRHTYNFTSSQAVDSLRFKIYLVAETITSTKTPLKEPLSYYRDENYIHIENIDTESNVTLYSTTGTLLYHDISHNTTHSIPTSLLSKGTYIIQINDKTIKITI